MIIDLDEFLVSPIEIFLKDILPGFDLCYLSIAIEEIPKSNFVLVFKNQIILDFGPKILLDVYEDVVDDDFDKHPELSEELIMFLRYLDMLETKMCFHPFAGYEFILGAKRMGFNYQQTISSWFIEHLGRTLKQLRLTGEF